ncbi:hypothetical protein [Antrihabitans spumae]|uniref:Uncharacterized protein n=1 Tax=Antrihabitans spumae TaxID=3373370 RepID=A0ABW7K708_9NOCA
MTGKVEGSPDSAARSELGLIRAAENVESDPRWAQYMLWSIPECSDVRDEILARSGRPVGSVDRDRVLATVFAASRDKLYELTIDRGDVSWEETKRIVARPDFDHRLLSAFLSTKGAVGIAISDKIAAFLSVHVPASVVLRVRSGDFDVR